MMNLLFATAISLSLINTGGWHHIEGENTFSDVAVSKEFHDTLVSSTNSAPFWGNIGPSGVFRAWNSTAFDPSNNTLYFFGGGHNDYGGNEVYSYNINSLTWSRITDPAALIVEEEHYKGADKRVFVPENTPLSLHTYDGIAWNPNTNSFWISTQNGFSGSGGLPPHIVTNPGIWEFTPATKQWTLHPLDVGFYRPMAAYVKSRQQMLFIEYKLSNKYHQAYLYDADGTAHSLGKVTGLDGSAVSNLFIQPNTGEIYSSHSEGIFKISITNDKASAEKITSFPSIEDIHFSTDYRQASVNYRPVDEKFYFWNGGARLLTWHPETNEFEVLWNEGQSPTPSASAKGAGKVFDKFVYIEEHDIFIGLTNGGNGQGLEGMWAWKPVANSPEIYKTTIGLLAIDGTTQTSASLFIPIEAGDKNYNASATLKYRIKGEQEWQQSINLSRIRAEFIRNTKNSTGISRSGFAGMITDLTADTQYEFQIQVEDPDDIVGEASQIVSAFTKNLPVKSGNTVINVSNGTQLQNALNNALPGTLIQLLPGHYQGSFEVKTSGTIEQPILIQGIFPKVTTIDAEGQKAFHVTASNISFSNLSIENASIAFHLDNGTDNIAIENNLITNVGSGIYAKGGHTGLYIADNEIEGKFLFGDVSSDTWNFEGIVVTGKDIEIVHNTLAGFGDAIGLHWNTPIPNIGINIHRNLVKWSGDDAIEFDFAQRNVAAHHNLVANSANGLSFQPVWGGPVYAFRNILLNQGRGPIKIKPEQDNPNGIIIAHNTIIKGNSDIYRGGGEAWVNTSGYIRQLYLFNNLFVSDNSEAAYTLKNDSSHSFVELSHNAWTADGRFNFNLAKYKYGISSKTFESWQKTELGLYDLLLDSTTLFKSYQPELSTKRFADYRLTDDLDLTLSDESQAVDAGKLLLGFNDNFTGAAPDIGAIESGSDIIIYGSRNNFLLPDEAIAVADIVTTEQGNAVHFFPLQNDFSPDGSPLIISGISSASSGVAVLNNDNSITYTPEVGFIGQVIIDYDISDSSNATSSSTITINVVPPNNPPVANNDNETTLEGQAITIPHFSLLANDTDETPQSLKIVAVTNPANGSVEDVDGSIVYTPDDGFLGGDQFQYTVEDEIGATDTALVSIEVISDGTIIGTEYRDHIDLSDKDDGFTIIGLGGSDIIYGSQGNDIIDGGSHEDHMWGNAGNDIFRYSGDNNKPDNIDGGEGTDSIIGNDQDNNISLYSLTSIEEVDGGEGHDVISGTSHSQTFDFSKITLRNIELIDGQSNSDILIGSQGPDKLKGSGGNDTLDGQAGLDIAIFDGPRRSYKISYSGNAIMVTDLSGNEGQDTLINIEVIKFADRQIILNVCGISGREC